MDETVEKVVLEQASDFSLLSLFFWPGSSITCQAHEDKKNDNNKTKKPLYIWIERYFNKKFDYYNFLNWYLYYALTAMGLKYLPSFILAGGSGKRSSMIDVDSLDKSKLLFGYIIFFNK